MSSPISLQTLIRRVPVCLQSITLDALWSVLAESQNDCVVVVDPEQHPVGLVYLRSLTPHVLSRSQREVPLDERNLADLGDRAIEPLLRVPAHLNWKDFWTYLRQIGQDLGWNAIPPFSDGEGAESLSPIALIDETGQFLGLIDLLKLLQLAVMQPPDAPKRQKPVSPKTNAESPQSFSFLTSMLQLLEPLPLPMMIQTQQGRVLGQNLAWRSQVGSEPETVRNAAQTVTQWSSRDAGATDNGEIPASPDSSGPQTGMGRSGDNPTADPTPDGSQRAGSTVLQTAPPPTSEPAIDPSLSPSSMPHWCHLSASPGTYICICPTPENRERVWQFARQPLHETGTSETPTGLWLILAQDITEQHRVAQELAAKNADLLQLNRLKDEFLACISHELKTPLTAVLGLSSLLKDRSLGELSDRQARYAKLIHQSGRHLMMVVNDILDLTRIETGQLELVPEGVTIRTACDRAFETARQLQQQDSAGNETESPETQHPFTLEIEPELETIEADELRLRQMLVNLISNAFKFTPEGGEIGLRVGRWEDWIAFTVWDTGIGIPEDKQHLIFEKFQQLESPLTRKFEGTGLGLVLTQRLARLHGGDVSFISKQGEGSRFTLLLPPTPPQKRWKSDALDWERSPSPTPAPAKRSNSARPTPQIQSRLILIVEAAPRFIHDLSDRVAKLGYLAIVARTGTEAVEKARRLQPRVIFLNPLLPLLSGWDVLTLLKTDAETRQIPVFITATSGDKKRAVQGCCDGFLSLPVQKSDLQLAFAQLERRPPPEPAKRLTVLWLSPVGEECRPPSGVSESNPFADGPFPRSSRMRDNLQLPEGGLPPRQRNSQISHCRILEADDLSQAELLARIWHPDAIVLENTDSVDDPVAFLRQFGEQENLANIPLVTLDSATTQAANQIETLSVFPCLASQEGRATPEGSQFESSALLQVIQVAAGMSWKPNILVVDLSTLPDFVESDGTQTARPHSADLRAPSSNDPTSKVERALIQYLQTAGFRGSLGRSWEEILQQLQCLSVDLLLICVRDPASPLLMEALSILRRVASPQENPRVTLPPILILDHSSLKMNSSRPQIPAPPVPDLPADLRALMEVEFLSGQISMAELLDRIRDRI